MQFKDLIKLIAKNNKEANISLIERSYDFSKNNLSEKELEHYVNLANEIVNLKLDDFTISAALLSGLDNLKEIEKYFGKEVSDILKNVNKINEVNNKVHKENFIGENLRKVLLATSKDLRALLVVICSNLVSLRELDYSNENRKVIAKDGMEIYAPLVYRLGIGKIKSEIEDLSFKYLEEEKYKKIEEKVNQLRKEGESSVFKLKRTIEKELKKENIEAHLQFRVKHIYSIYKKVIEKTNSLEQIRDIVAFRVIVKTLDDCYKVLRIIHSTFVPVQNTFKDYIAMPKPNGYQSLHTSVLDKDGRIFEVQIRTEEMHEIAEDGVASHFSYKGIKHEKQFDRKLSWMKEIVESKDNFDMDLFSEEIYVFTPKGDVFQLPIHSSVLDFAYRVHAQIGNSCTGANVNGKFVSLKQELENGDIVEILTSKSQRPNREWLKYARTSKAREKIRQALREAGKVVGGVYYISENKKQDFGETLLVYDEKNLISKLALCCKPLPGDNVLGIKSSATRLMVHRINCDSALISTKKKVRVGWVENFTKPVEIAFEAKDRQGLLKEVINSLKSVKFEISNQKGKMINEEDIECSLTADVKNLEKLNDLIARLKKINGVKKVYVKVI